MAAWFTQPVRPSVRAACASPAWALALRHAAAASSPNASSRLRWSRVTRRAFVYPTDRTPRSSPSQCSGTAADPRTSPNSVASPWFGIAW